MRVGSLGGECEHGTRRRNSLDLGGGAAQYFPEPLPPAPPMARTASVNSGRATATMRAAMTPAARASPIGTVPTGTPAGVWGIDSRGVGPARAWDLTGTPITGTSVKAATMPGRWAAPPAPA